MESHTIFFERALHLAHEAGALGNLPIGAVICYDGNIIAEGQNAIWHPQFNANRHAEIEALRNVPAHLWVNSRAMTLYTTLEPCLMCLSAILLHHIGRIVFGTVDPYGGASIAFGHLPPFFEEEFARTLWVGPAYHERCDPLYERIKMLENRSDRSP